MPASVQEQLDELRKDVDRLLSQTQGEKKRKKRGSKRANSSTKKRKTGMNGYMYWCNVMGNRKAVSDELKGNGVSDMKQVVSELGKRWNALSDEDKADVKARLSEYTYNRDLYGFWCENMHMEESVSKELADADPESITTELKKRWEALPDEAKEKVKVLYADHKKPATEDVTAETACVE